MRVVILRSFQVTNFQHPHGSSGRHVTLPAGTYDLVVGEHIDPAWRHNNPMLFLQGYPQVGACKGWWDHEIASGRMGEALTGGENPRVVAGKNFFR